MNKTKTYQDILSSKIINARPATIAKKLGVSIITAEWLKTMVKEQRQEIVKNEIDSKMHCQERKQVSRHIITWGVLVLQLEQPITVKFNTNPPTRIMTRRSPPKHFWMLNYPTNQSSCWWRSM